jgi:ABC-type Co2+ transport system, permease component
MHIPDGYLDPLTAFMTWVVAVGYAFYAYKYSELRTKPELILSLAAAVFVAQMLNWPLPGGTSLHFVGGALVAILTGPFNAYFTMLMVLIVQTLIFQDGGITTLGANAIAMGIVAPWAGYILYKVLKTRIGTAGAASVAGWISVAASGTAVGILIGLSTWFPYSLGISVPIMAIWHSILGVGEGVITGLAVLYILRKAPHYIAT